MAVLLMLIHVGKLTYSARCAAPAVTQVDELCSPINVRKLCAHQCLKNRNKMRYSQAIGPRMNGACQEYMLDYQLITDVRLGTMCSS